MKKTITESQLCNMIRREINSLLTESIQKTSKQKKAFDKLVSFYTDAYHEFLDEKGIDNNPESGEYWEEETTMDDYYYEPLKDYVALFNGEYDEKELAEEVFAKMDKVYNHNAKKVGNRISPELAKQISEEIMNISTAIPPNKNKLYTVLNKYGFNDNSSITNIIRQISKAYSEVDRVSKSLRFTQKNRLQSLRSQLYIVLVNKPL
jgi:hypothetical protein